MKTLHQAVFSNETELVNQLISNGANVNEPNFDGSTPLHIACRDGLLEMVKILIENGAIIDFKSKVQPSALQLAVISWWNFDIVSYLLEKGANPNFTAGGKYNSPLTTAIERQDVRTITVKSQIQTAVSIDYFVFENLKCASNQGRLLFIY